MSTQARTTTATTDPIVRHAIDIDDIYHPPFDSPQSNASFDSCERYDQYEALVKDFLFVAPEFAAFLASRKTHLQRQECIDGCSLKSDDAGMRKDISEIRESARFVGGPVKQDVTHLLILRFQEMLRQGVLGKGSRLPPERELAVHFNVARSSLRQALKVLEIMGVVTQRVGDGSYLNTDTSAILSVPMEFIFLLDETSIEELTELRLLIEPGLARLAAERATTGDIALLRRSVRDFENSGNDALKIVSSDLLFHQAIFQASKNRPSTRVFHSIHQTMAKMILVTSQLVDLKHTLAFHRPIMLAIERRDGDRAAKLMAEHLADAASLVARGEANEHDRLLRRHIIAGRQPIKAKQRSGRAHG